MSLRPRLVLAPLVCALACNPSNPPRPDDEGEDCFMYQPPAESADWPTRELELGTLDEDGNFTPWIDGGEVSAVLGYQGFWMLMPGFLVARAANVDGDGQACWFVRVDVGDPERELEPLTGVYPGGLAFEPRGDQMRAGPLFHVIDAADIGTRERMDVTVYGDDFTASASVEYTIVEP